MENHQRFLSESRDGGMTRFAFGNTRLAVGWKAEAQDSGRPSGRVLVQEHATAIQARPWSSLDSGDEIRLARKECIY